MNKDLNKVIEILDMTKYSLEEIRNILDEGKTLLISLEKGEHVSRSLKNSYSPYLEANVEIKEEKENCGICGCGKPANILVYA